MSVYISKGTFFDDEKSWPMLTDISNRIKILVYTGSTFFMDLSKQFWCPLYSIKNSILDWNLKLNLQATKFGGNDQAITLWLPHL